MKKLLCVLLCACLLAGFAGCGKKLPALNAEFIALQEACEVLNDVVWGSHGWHLVSRGEYLFAGYWRYLLRYSIAENRVDKVIVYDWPERDDYISSFSEDGRYCIAYMMDVPHGVKLSGNILIDFEAGTAEPTKQERYPFPEDLRGIAPEQLAAMQNLRLDLGDYVPIDENRVGAIVPHESSNIGHHKFVVIDVEQDIIIQECPLNV